MGNDVITESRWQRESRLGLWPFFFLLLVTPLAPLKNVRFWTSVWQLKDWDRERRDPTTSNLNKQEIWHWNETAVIMINTRLNYPARPASTTQRWFTSDSGDVKFVNTTQRWKCWTVVKDRAGRPPKCTRAGIRFLTRENLSSSRSLRGRLVVEYVRLFGPQVCVQQRPSSFLAHSMLTFWHLQRIEHERLSHTRKSQFVLIFFFFFFFFFFKAELLLIYKQARAPMAVR